MQKGNLISVIIPTYNHYDRDIGLSDLVESLLSTPNEELIGEIIIVDNGNSLVVDELESVNEKIKVVSEMRIGLNYARNTGVISASFNIVAFIDDDITVSTDWASGIIEGHSNYSILCVGGAVLVDKKDSVKYPYWFSDYFLRFLFPPIFPEQAGIIHFPYFLIGANMSFKKQAFDKFGLFDTELDRKGKNLLSNGDIEFIMRISIDKVWYEPQAIVFEKISKTRLTRRFMVRRLFWQGVSDYIMVKKRGPDDFYNKNEIFFTTYFFKKIKTLIAYGHFFESLCMFIRQLGFRYGRIYLNRKQEVGIKPTS